MNLLKRNKSVFKDPKLGLDLPSLMSWRRGSKIATCPQFSAEVHPWISSPKENSNSWRPPICSWPFWNCLFPGPPPSWMTWQSTPGCQVASATLSWHWPGHSAARFCCQVLSSLQPEPMRGLEDLLICSLFINSGIHWANIYVVPNVLGASIETKNYL